MIAAACTAGLLAAAWGAQTTALTRLQQELAAQPGVAELAGPASLPNPASLPGAARPPNPMLAASGAAAPAGERPTAAW